MAVTRYAGNIIRGNTADPKPTQGVLDGSLYFELDGDKRVFEIFGGVWEELIGEDIEVVDSIEIDEGKIRLVGDEENPGNNKVYGTNASGERTWKDDPSGGGGGGEANTASNVGGAVALFLEKVGVDLRFRTIEAGDNITFDLSDPNKVVINGEGGGGGGGSNQIEFATPITSTSANLTKSLHAGKWVEVNNANDITLTLLSAEFQTGDVITIEQIGAGQVEVIVQNGSDQTIVVAANKTWGQYSVIQVVCKDDTSGNEIFTITGGIE